MKILNYAAIAFIYAGGETLLRLSEKNCQLSQETDQAVLTYKSFAIQNDPFYACCNATLQDMLQWEAVSLAEKSKMEKEDPQYYLEWGAIGAAVGVFLHDRYGNKDTKNAVLTPKLLPKDESKRPVYAVKSENYYPALFKPEAKMCVKSLQSAIPITESTGGNFNAPGC